MSIPGAKKKKSDFSLKDRFRSFRFAFSGIYNLFRYEHNAWIHLLILILVVLTGIFLAISTFEWIAIAIMGGFVFACECFNTSIEFLSDFISPGIDENIKKVKDIAAAGVLFSVIASVIVGLIIFLPRLIKLIV
jgi:diacylglycerol kinase